MRRAGCALLLLVVACSTRPPAPVVPPWTDPVTATAPIDADEQQLRQAAAEARAKLEKDGEIVTDAELAAYLNGVLALLLPPIPSADAPKPTVFIVRSPYRVAGTTADGAVMISTSMLAALRNEAQLAAVFGHELGHFVGRHQLIRRRYTKASRSMAERMALSREQETAADAFALAALRRAELDPHALAEMLALIEPDEDLSAAAEPFRSHPFTEERITAAKKAVRPNELGTRRDDGGYDRAVVAILPVAAEVELRAHRYDQAQATISRLLALRPDDGRAYFLKGEHARLTDRDGRRSPAVRFAYERAVELAPDDPQAVRALGFLYQDDGDRGRAAPLLQKYLSLAPDAADRKLVERSLAGSGAH